MKRAHAFMEMIATIAAMCALVAASRAVADYIVLPLVYGIYK